MVVHHRSRVGWIRHWRAGLPIFAPSGKATWNACAGPWRSSVSSGIQRVVPNDEGSLRLAQLLALLLHGIFELSLALFL